MDADVDMDVDADVDVRRVHGVGRDCVHARSRSGLSRVETTGSIMAMAQNHVLFVKKSCIPSLLEHFITVHQCEIGLDVDHSQTLDHLLTQIAGWL